MIGHLIAMAEFVLVFTGVNGGIVQQKNSSNEVVSNQSFKLNTDLGYGSLYNDFNNGDDYVELNYDNYVNTSPFLSYSDMTFDDSTVYYDLLYGSGGTYDLPLFNVRYSQNYEGNGPAVIYTSWQPLNFYVNFTYECIDEDYDGEFVRASFNNLTCFLTSQNIMRIQDNNVTYEYRYAESVYYLPSSFQIVSVNNINFSIYMELVWFYGDWNITDAIEGGGVGFDYWSGYNTALWNDSHIVGDYPDYIDGYNAGYTIGYQTAHNEDFDSVYTNGYNTGYTYGNSDGYRTGYTEGVNSVDTQSYYLDGVNTGYWNGYAVGYQEGATAPTYTFGELFGSIADTPVLIIRGLFDFDFFGINLMTVVLSMFTALIALYIVRKLL